ncbi:MAG: glycoside hydrolase family 3 C-terminal domain-containing protein, partial [Alphaproteobacteria bacterium]|nr:glycoside hydrolase family 3 C-terminal domain-containing protein [Alphaproteobacteria bacterium]
TPEPIAQNAADMERVAADSAVLLKNDGVLPLKSADLADTVFIGAGARQTFAVVYPGERATGYPEREIGVVKALKSRTGVDAPFAVGEDMAGTAIPAAAFEGLTRTSGSAAQPDAVIDYTNANGKALHKGTHAVWKGNLNAVAAGDYDLDLAILGASGEISVDGKKIGGTSGLALHGDVLHANTDDVLPTPDGLDSVRRQVTLSAGKHSIEVKADADTSGNPVQVRLAWVTPEQRAANRAAAIDAAHKAKTAVVFVWSRGKPDPFALPGDQNVLIADIAAANPNTIVILNTGGPVAMPWLDKVKGVMEMWYSGDEGGWALADLLTGKRVPAGRLPFTWPVKLTDMPANNPA